MSKKLWFIYSIIGLIAYIIVFYEGIVNKTTIAQGDFYHFIHEGTLGAILFIIISIILLIILSLSLAKIIEFYSDSLKNRKK